MAFFDLCCQHRDLVLVCFGVLDVGVSDGAKEQDDRDETPKNVHVRDAALARIHNLCVLQGNSRLRQWAGTVNGVAALREGGQSIL